MSFIRQIKKGVSQEAAYPDPTLIWFRCNNERAGLLPVGLVVIGLCSALPAGREFATSFMQNLGCDGKETRFSVEVAALPFSQGRTTVRVTAEGEVKVEEIEPGNSFSFKLPTSVDMKGSKKSNQTVLSEASQDVSVTSLNFKQYTADTSVVYPVKDWGTEYYTFTPTGDHISHPSSPFGVYSLGVASADGYGSPASGETAEKHDCSTMKCPEDEVCKMSRNSPTCVVMVVLK
ncbi:unnamed protein product [Pleuronectes platessa]|uniref:Uncharacterized protein n=1 Tax=Pleuronectes platessa TaxID=8262 RepID=A0A9N7V5V7_PLEPL|nr:unnamed protein product [Pleuronectes platessa]